MRPSFSPFLLALAIAADGLTVIFLYGLGLSWLSTRLKAHWGWDEATTTVVASLVAFVVLISLILAVPHACPAG